LFSRFSCEVARQATQRKGGIPKIVCHAASKLNLFFIFQRMNSVGRKAILSSDRFRGSRLRVAELVRQATLSANGLVAIAVAVRNALILALPIPHAANPRPYYRRVVPGER
jgi:hypothetical protein